MNQALQWLIVGVQQDDILVWRLIFENSVAWKLVMVIELLAHSGFAYPIIFRGIIISPQTTMPPVVSGMMQVLHLAQVTPSNNSTIHEIIYCMFTPSFLGFDGASAS